MNDEQRKILEMVADGTLTQQDADRLLEALGPAPEAAPEEEPSQDLGDRIAKTVEHIVDRSMGAFGAFSGEDLGEKISAAVGKAAKKGWSFHRSWPFGEGQVNVDLDIEDDEEE